MQTGCDRDSLTSTMKKLTREGQTVVSAVLDPQTGGWLVVSHPRLTVETRDADDLIAVVQEATSDRAVGAQRALKALRGLL